MGVRMQVFVLHEADRVERALPQMSIEEGDDLRHLMAHEFVQTGVGEGGVLGLPFPRPVLMTKRDGNVQRMPCEQDNPAALQKSVRAGERRKGITSLQMRKADHRRVGIQLPIVLAVQQEPLWNGELALQKPRKHRSKPGAPRIWDRK